MNRIPRHPLAIGLTAAVLTVLPARADAPQGDDSAKTRFETLSLRYLDRFPALSPIAATQLGDHRFDGDLDEITPAARAASAAFARDLLQELDAVDGARLSRASRLDETLLRHALEAQIWRIEELRAWERDPLIYTGLAGSSVYGLLAREFAPLEERLVHVADRLEKLPRFLGQVREALVAEEVPKIHAETAIKQNRGLLSILDNMVTPHLDVLEHAQRQRLERSIETARSAIETHQTWLEEELLPHASGAFRIGAETFDRKLAFTLHTKLTRHEIRERAEREFRRVRDEMYEIAREVYVARHPYTEFPADPDGSFRQAIIRAALEVAYENLPQRDALVETARAQLIEATEFTRAKELVSIPDDPLEIIIMPEFQRGVAVAYCDSPGPLDVGQKTFYAVAPLPEEWTDEQVHSFLREYNLYSMQDLTIHEAMPGHFLQLAHSNRYPSTLRAVLASGTFIEGWAVYAERLMVDAGYLGGDPLMRLVNLKWYLRVVTNAIMDQAIHVDGMTEDEAMKLMVEGGLQEEREAAGKWVRAQLTSTQLSTYFVGYQEHADLRRDAEAAWGKQFELGPFHDLLLSFGSPPVGLVRPLVLAEAPASQSDDDDGETPR